MERALGLKSFRFSLLILLSVISFNSYSQQQLQLIDSVMINSPDLLSADKAGNIYATDIKGNLYRFNHQLKNAMIYSPPVPARITSFDALTGLRIFIFYQDIQEFTLLNRFLDSPTNYKIGDETLGFIVAATPSFDNKLWLFDQSSLSLVKYDYQNQQVEFEKPLNLTLNRKLQNILVFREYQNRVYLADEEGELYVFDNLGNFLLKKAIPKLEWIGFDKNDMYFIENGKLAAIDLYSLEHTAEYPLPMSEGIKMIVRVEGKLYIMTKGKIYSYLYNQ